MKLRKGVYYNRVRDDLILITKSTDKNFWNKETEVFSEECIVTFYYSNEQGDIVNVKNALLVGANENLEYIGEL